MSKAARSSHHRDHCTDSVVGAILSGWRYDISGLSPETRTDYEAHLADCTHCRRRQHVHRTVDVLLISVSTLSICAFLLAIAVIHRVEALTHTTSFHVHLHDVRMPTITIPLETVAIAGLVISMLLWALVAMMTPLPGLLREHIPEDLRDRIFKHAGLIHPMHDTSKGEVLPPSPPAPPHPPDYAPAQKHQRDFRVWDLRSAPATYVLVAINIAVFLWMLAHGVSARNPTPDDLLHYGANDTYQVLARGEWYRVLTAIFLHVGFVHLAANMWCLWNLGLLGEPLIGPLGLAAVYLLTGIAGNLLSLAWDVVLAGPVSPINSSIGAGASGAVFGIAGLLIVLLSNRRLPIPWSELRRLRSSVIQFAVLNLIIGGATILPFFGSIVRIDNSAHLGGFLTGLALGGPLVPRMTAGRQGYLGRQKIVFAAATLILALFGYWIYRLR